MGGCDFVSGSPFFTQDAMMWIAEQRVPILGGDMPCSDNPKFPLGINQILFKSGALILAPLSESFRTRRITLLAVPLKIVGSSGSPCRTIGVEIKEGRGQMRSTNAFRFHGRLVRTESIFYGSV